MFNNQLIADVKFVVGPPGKLINRLGMSVRQNIYEKTARKLGYF